MSLEYTTAKKRRDPIEFTLDGEDYVFTPQKSAEITLALADGDSGDVARSMFSWLEQGLPEEQNARLKERLQDPADDFDVPDLGDLIGNLQSEIAGRPTTSRGASSASQNGNGRSSTGGRRRKASTSSR